ncbi:MAG: asparagine synthase (glutamine-hydrolyzing) [Elusimicrobia bacterium GWC2_64_44]|nr:MAG: asparagine synthase (glutamine-hydrolyzing) [Elusimicrobia bacterium GWC2_64_44]
MISGICRLTSPLDKPLLRLFPAGAGAYASANTALKSESADASLFAGPDGASLLYSGELYNYKELRRELESSGCRFATSLESELVYHAYARWGAGCQEKFNGEWAFARWDEKNKSLFCSRDRFGLRPLHYFFDGKTLVFASGLKALFACPLVPKAPNPQAVYDFLVLNHCNQPEETFFEGVRKLGAGCCMYFTRPGRSLTIRRYYDPACNQELGRPDKKALARHAAEFRGLLEDAVRLRLGGSEPLGILLSGGLDSSSITCLASRLLAKKDRPPTFSIPWPREAPFIRASSAAAGFPRCEVTPAGFKAIPWSEVAALARAAEKPVMDASVLGEMQLIKAAKRRGVKVLLEGSGGDEMLAGYPERNFTVYLNQVLRERGVAAFSAEFKTFFADRLGEFGVEGEPGPEFYKCFLRTQSCAPELSEFFVKETVNRDLLGEYAGRRHPLQRGPEFNLQQVLKRDTLALGNELEHLIPFRFRLPLLDHRLAEYAFSLPACYKLHGGWTKYLLRTAMTGVLPDQVCWRKEKVGGTAPVSVWKDFMKRNRRELKAALSGRKFYASDFINRASVLKNFDALFAAAIAPGTTDISGLWRFVSLELWLRENLN